VYRASFSELPPSVVLPARLPETLRVSTLCLGFLCWSYGGTVEIYPIMISLYFSLGGLVDTYAVHALFQGYIVCFVYNIFEL
jgi:hypothetical protein